MDDLEVGPNQLSTHANIINLLDIKISIFKTKHKY